MAISRKGKVINNQLHEGKIIKQIYHIGKKYLAELLSPAAIAAIEAAFGAEAVQVTYRTKNYLNAIALTDTARAQQLAEFINEDPLLVTSLVETSKVRTLDGDGKAYINTGIYAEKKTGFDVSLITTDNDNNACGMLSGSSKGNDAGLELYYWDRTWQIISNNTIATGVSVVVGQQYRIIRLGEEWAVYENGTEKAKGTKAMVAYTSNTPIFLYCLNRGNSVSYNGKPRFIHAIIKQYGGSDILHLCPFIRNGENGMLDILSGTFYPNANTSGAFTIQLADKTPA